MISEFSKSIKSINTYLKQFIEKLVSNEDIASLDVIFITAYALKNTCKTGYEKYRDVLEEVLRQLIHYNLRLKHGLTENECAEKLKILDQLYLQHFISYSDCDKILLELDTAKDILQKYVESKLRELRELDKKVLSFILQCKSKVAKDSNYYYKFEYFDPMYNPKKLTLIFDHMFNETLLAQNVLKLELDEDKPFWEIGDTIVKAGVGYWIPYISKNCHIYLDLITPKFLFEVLERNRHLLPKIDNFDKRFEEIQKKLEENNNIERELHDIFIGKIKNKITIEKFKMPAIREPMCENDLYFLIGRCWDIIREKIGLEDIVFVDKHWDAEGIYKGKKVRIEVKVDAKEFDKDPTKIDLLICWKITSSGNILGQIYFDELKSAEYRSNKAKL